VLTGVIHLPPLPGSPRSSLALSEIAKGAARDAQVMRAAGFDACIVENFGDAPFEKGAAAPVTLASMTVCALSVQDALQGMPLGINVLRNDAQGAMAIAVAVGAKFVRINIHMGARVTDQGVIEGEAARTLRTRAALLGAKAEELAIWADVDVKHSMPLGGACDLEQETEDLVKRGLASAVLVTGQGTGHGVDEARTARVQAALRKASDPAMPVYIASGATIGDLPRLAKIANGVIVGSALRASGKAGGAMHEATARAFCDAYRKVF
jgi:uncharacterized protein